MAKATVFELGIPCEPSLLAFPEKLWWIVNDQKCEDICWDLRGKSIVIENTQTFASNVLNNPSSAMFKTKNFTSFVRQLNLYGFRKVTERARSAIPAAKWFTSRCEFKHPFFQKGRRDLLVLIKRQYSAPKKTQEAQKKSRTLPPKDAQLGVTHARSFGAVWNSAMLPPMSFLPWQSCVYPPLALYPPFCNSAQPMAHLSLAPGATPTSSPPMLTHGSVSLSLSAEPRLGTSDSGGIPCIPASFTDKGHSYAGLVFSHGMSPRTSVEGLNGTNFATRQPSNAPVVTRSTPNVVIINNSLEPCRPVAPNIVAMRSSLFPEGTSASDRKQPLSAQNTITSLSQEGTHSFKRKAADAMQPDPQPKENGDAVAMKTSSARTTIKDTSYDVGIVPHGDRSPDSPFKKANTT